MNRKLTLGAKVPRDVLERIERLANADRRSLSAMTSMAIEAGLPKLEREVLGSSPADADTKSGVNATDEVAS